MALLERIRRLNVEYLSLAQDISRASALAAALLGVNQEVVQIIGLTPLTKFRPLAHSPMLVPQLRVQDAGVWHRFAQERIDVNQLLHEFLRTLPADFPES